MTTQPTQPPQLSTKLFTLPFEQRVVLAQELWDSVHMEAQAAPFTPEQLAEVDRRIALADAGELIAEPWDAVRAELLGDL